MSKIIEDINLAIRNDEFVIYYQPIVNILEQRIVGVEILTKWQHPEKGCISCDDFVEHIESGLLGKFFFKMILNKAYVLISQEILLCKFFVGMYISFNASVGNLLSDGVVSVIVEYKNKFKKIGVFIAVELTERQDPLFYKAIGPIFEILIKENVFMLMDDFGSGYANNLALKSLPFDKFKVDRLLTARYSSGNVSSELISLVNLAKELSKDIIFEGVETKQQLERLRQCGVKYVQGYYISPPHRLDRLCDEINRQTGLTPRR